MLSACHTMAGYATRSLADRSTQLDRGSTARTSYVKIRSARTDGKQGRRARSVTSPTPGFETWGFLKPGGLAPRLPGSRATRSVDSCGAAPAPLLQISDDPSGSSSRRPARSRGPARATRRKRGRRLSRRASVVPLHLCQLDLCWGLRVLSGFWCAPGVPGPWLTASAGIVRWVIGPIVSA